MSSTRNSVNEPSLYIENMKQYLTQKNEKLSTDAVAMNKSATELQNQIDGVVSSCSGLEKAKKEMAEEVSEYLLKINELQKQNFVDEDKITKLNTEISDLKESINNVESEKTNRLSMVSQLQEQLDNKEKEWSNQKTMLLQELEQIDDALKNYISSTEMNISTTTKMIEAANEKLLTRMPFGETRSMYFTDNDDDPLSNFGSHINKVLHYDSISNHESDDEESNGNNLFGSDIVLNESNGDNIFTNIDERDDIITSDELMNTETQLRINDTDSEDDGEDDGEESEESEESED